MSVVGCTLHTSEWGGRFLPDAHRFPEIANAMHIACVAVEGGRTAVEGSSNKLSYGYHTNTNEFGELQFRKRRGVRAKEHFPK